MAGLLCEREQALLTVSPATTSWTPSFGPQAHIECLLLPCSGQLVYPASLGGYNPYRSPLKCFPEDCEYGCSAFSVRTSRGYWTHDALTDSVSLSHPSSPAGLRRPQSSSADPTDCAHQPESLGYALRREAFLPSRSSGSLGGSTSCCLTVALVSTVAVHARQHDGTRCAPG